MPYRNSESNQKESKERLIPVFNKRHLANILTCIRGIGSLLLLCFPVFSVHFYVTYLLCGFTDMIDGPIARKMGSVSEFGNRLDSIADLLFVSASFIQLFPVLTIPRWLWIWTLAIALLRFSNLTYGYVYKGKFILLHTTLNKATGLLLFLLPFTLTFIEVKHSAIFVCLVATCSALQESHYLVKSRNISS